MFTTYKGLCGEMLPVFSSEEKAISMAQSLGDKTAQVETVPLSRLQEVFAGGEIHFMLDPEAIFQGGQPYLREESSWGLTIDDLGNFLMN